MKLQTQGYADQTQPLAEKIAQVSAPVGRRALCPVAVNDDDRRRLAPLMSIAQCRAQPAATDGYGWWRVCHDGGGQESRQFGGRDFSDG